MGIEMDGMSHRKMMLIKKLWDPDDKVGELGIFLNLFSVFFRV